MPLFLSMYVFSILGFAIHWYWTEPAARSSKRMLELLLLYQLIFSLGITSLLAFIGLTFMAEYVAEYSGWPMCPFQQELGNVNLSFGILGLMCIWWRGDFWTATVLGFSIWILADGIHHIFDIISNHNYAPGSIGVSLITDLIVPIVLLVSAVFYQNECKKSLPTKSFED